MALHSDRKMERDANDKEEHRVRIEERQRKWGARHKHKRHRHL